MTALLLEGEFFCSYYIIKYLTTAYLILTCVSSQNLNLRCSTYSLGHKTLLGGFYESFIATQRFPNTVCII